MRARCVWIVIVGMMTGCAGAPVVDASGPPPVASAPPLASPSAAPPTSAPSSSAMASAPSSAPPPPPIPPAPPGADAEKVLFASSICAAAVMPSPGDPKKVLVGCRAHPPFDAPDRRPDGKLPVFSGDPLRFCAIDAIRRGAFTRSGAKQAVVSFEACKEDESTWDAGNPGSAVLVEEHDGAWRAIAYVPDVNAGRCERIPRPDGRDVLACRSSFSAPTIGTLHYFFSLDFARAKPAGTFARLGADLFDCASFEATGSALPNGVVSLAIDRTSVADRNGDGASDYVVEVERARAAPSAGLDAKARAICKRSPGDAEKSLLPRAKKTTLVFAAQGDALVPTPDTQKLLDAWRAETPTPLEQLKQAAPPDVGR